MLDELAATLSELTSRYLAGLQDERAWIAGALALFGVSSWLLLRRPGAKPRPGVWWVLTALLVIGGCLWAFHLAWVSDDAHISFRYARNLVAGEGLVYNPGDRVEGYTDFLWVLLLALLHALGFALDPASIVLTLAFTAATLVFTAVLARRLCARDSMPELPIAGALLASNYVFACYGTSGMETMSGTLLVLLAVERAHAGAALTAGTLGVLATMAHPDHAIFYAALAGALALGADPRRALPRYALPFFALYLPYFAWRWSYYGDFFPNTYYAKNTQLSYFAQGTQYLLISGLSAGLCVALPVAVYATLRFRQLLIARFAAIAVPLYLVYLAKIGGDFMLGRLLCPLLPPVFILAELGVRALLAQGRRWEVRGLGVTALGLLCSVAVPVRLIGPGEQYRYIADERTYYSVLSYRPFALDAPFWTQADELNRILERVSRKPKLVLGSIGIVGDRTSVPLIDSYGLVDRGVAHTRTRWRGRPGHEKWIGAGNLIESGVDLSFAGAYPPEYQDLGWVQLAGFGLHTVRYDEQLFAELAAAGVPPPPLPAYLQAYGEATEELAPDRVDCDLWFMEQIYFKDHPQSAYRDAIVSRVVAGRPAWSGYEDFILTEPGTSSSEWAPVARMAFDALPEGTVVDGYAFIKNPVRSESRGQGQLTGQVGAFINTYRERNGDEAVGTLVTPEFAIEGDVITVRVGGGRDPERERVELLVGNDVRYSATGCGADVLGRRVWPVSSLKGSKARFSIVDQGTGGWGHLLVDELVQWRRLGLHSRD